MGKQETIRILIAEDDFLVGRSTAALLRTMGYTVVGQALNGQQAVEMTRSLQPDVILMDIKMPIMDGIEATQHIHETCPTPVVALTAHATPEVIERAIAAGVGAYLTKPANPQEMERAINVTIAQFDDMVELRRLNTELKAEIAERKRAEEALKESEERYRELVEKAGIAILLDDREGGFKYFNETFAEWFGYSVEEMKQQSIRTLVHPDDLDRVMGSHAGRVRGSEVPSRYEFRGVEKDGSIRYLEVDAVELKEGDRVIGTSSYLWDITERKRVAEEIKQRNQELSALNAIATTMMQSTLGLDEVLQRIADGLVEGLSCTTALIFLLDEKEGIFKGRAVSTRGKIIERINALIGFPLVQIKLPARRDFNEATSNALEGRITIKHNMYELIRPILSKPVCSALEKLAGSKTFLSLPLLAKGKVVGGIFASTRAEEISEGYAETMMTFANQAAIAIENARLFEETQQRALEQETLREAALALTTALDRNQVVDRILAQLQQVVLYDSASVQLLRENRMEIVGGRGFPNLPDLLGISFPADGDNPNSEVIHTRAPVIVEDAPAVYEAFRQVPHRRTSIRSWMGVPMLVSERLVGMIALDKNEPGFYTQQHARLAEAFAAQAAVAIENARLFEEEKRRATQLALINEVGDKAASILDSDRLTQEVTRSIQESFNYYNVALLLLDEARGEVMMQAVAGGFARMVPSEYRQSVDEGIIGLVVRTGQSRMVSDVSKDPHYVKGFVGEVLTKSELCVPIKLGDKVIGALDVQSIRLNDFDQSEVVAMEAMADRVAIGLENARLYEETRHRAEEIAALYEIALATSATLKTDELLKRIYEQVEQLVSFDAFWVALVDEERGELRFEITMEAGKPLPKRTRKLEARGSLAGWVAHTRKPFLIRHWDREKDVLPAVTHQVGRPVQSWLGIPLLFRDRAVGVVAVQSFEPYAFGEKEQHLLTIFATQAAIAIENARLFSEAKQRATELSTMLEAARAVSSTLDLEQVLALIAEEMIKATGVAGCTLSRWDRKADAVVTFTGGRQRRLEATDEPGTSYALDDFPATRTVLEKRQPISILATDPDTGPAEIALLEKNSALSLLMLPLVIGERVIGLVELAETKRKREFTDAEIHLCQALADQVAMAIENARLFEEEKRRSTQLALINEVGEKAASILDSDRLMQEVTRSIQESFNYYNVALFLLDNERREVVVQAVAGGFEHIIRGKYRQSLDEGIIGFVAKTGKSRLANDVNKDSYYIRGFLGKVLNGSELCVPIKLGDEVIGVLDMQSAHLNGFDQADIVAMGAVADRLAMGIQNARLYEEVAGLYDVGLAVTSALELDKTLRTIYEQTNHLMSPDTFYIALYDEVRGELRFDIFVEEGEWLPKFTKKLDKGGLTTWIVQSRNPLFIGDFEKESPPVTPGQVGKPEIKSWLGFPLLVKDKVVGVISVQSFRPHAFTEGNKRTLSAFANQAAIAIENAHLFEEIERRRMYLEGVLREAPDAIITLDDSFHIVEWNAGAERLFEYSREEALGQHLDHLVTNLNVFEEATGFTQRVLGGKALPPTETVRYRKDGSPVDVIVAGSPILIGEELIGVVAVYTDITERVRAEREIEKRRMYLEGVLGAAPDAIVTLDAHHRIVEWNSGAERLFGYSWEEVAGKNIDYVVTRPDVFEEASRLTQKVTDGEEVPPTEAVRYRKDGSPVDVIVAGSPILIGEELIGVVAVYTDITARVQMEETLRALALLDELTGLYNRRGFLTLSRQQLKMANRTKMKMALLFADLDDLKRINDTFGHSEGDQALIETANVLEGTFRESDTLARIGGDEFVVLAIETDGLPAEALTTRLQENLKARNARGDLRYELSLSVGLARYDPERPCSVDDLLTQADKTMYEKKRGNQKV